MLYESDFAYFLRNPAREPVKRSYLTTLAENNKVFVEQKKIPDFVLLNVNEVPKSVDKMKNISFIQVKPKLENVPKVENKFKANKQSIQKSKKNIAKKDSLKKLFVRYCENTTVHGLRYFAQKNQHWSERVLWIILVLMAMGGIIYVSLLLSERFNSTPLATVVETTIYPVSEIAYPAVTICNFNRVNWNHVEAAKKKHIPNATEAVVQQFESYLKTINRLEYGSFDEFVDIDDWDIEALEHINLQDLYRDVAYSCEELFGSSGTCWWRNRYYNCCEIFHYQRSEYGICQSFNSVTNSAGYETFVNSTNYPRRTSSATDWSGLRIEITMSTKGLPPNLTAEDMGLMVIVGNPFEWPSNGYLVPAGTNTGVSVHPTFSYSTENIYHLEISERNCIFDEDIELNRIENASVMRLPLRLDRYYVGNCYSECRQQHMIKFCNCTIDFFYKSGNYTPCRMSGIKCLNKYDTIMNYQKPPSGNPFFSDDEPGISCKCWQECTRTEYAVEVAPNMLSEPTPGKIILDVHYQRPSIVKYRTDVVFGWTDLMVGFGGIAGLFLGSSILSGVEFLYYMGIGIVLMLKDLSNFRTKEKPVS